MRATKAYIASLGTTGILLAASILMLAVVSAVVAFDRWPDGGVSTRVQTVMLNERPAAIRVSADSKAPSATPSDRAQSASASTPRAATPVLAPGRLIVGDENLSGSERSAGGGSQPALPGTGLPKVPAPDADPIFEAISNPSTTRGQVAEGAQAFTDDAAAAVGQVSPDAGEAVAASGQAAADALRGVPLPGHLLPDH